jgi:hypothetical protein
MNKQWRDGFDSALYEARANKKDPACPASVNKQWIYRNGKRPFSVTEIYAPAGYHQYVSVNDDSCMRIHDTDGTAFIGSNQYDLIPYEPYSEFKIDDTVNGWDDESGEVTSGHFAGLDMNGRPTIFHNGGTSFTRHPLQRSSWNFCEKAAPKEDSSNV